MPTPALHFWVSAGGAIVQLAKRKARLNIVAGGAEPIILLSS